MRRGRGRAGCAKGDCGCQGREGAELPSATSAALPCWLLDCLGFWGEFFLFVKIFFHFRNWFFGVSLGLLVFL